METKTEPSGLLARVRASAWASLFARVALLGSALLILAAIGRVATAGAAGPSHEAVVASDGGIDASAMPPSPVEPMPPPPAAPPPAAPAASAGPRARASPEDPVFLNQADETELRRLPGVGAKRAEAIVALRRRVGRFQRIEDLMRVKGVGRAAIKKWRPVARLDAPAQDAGAP